ncbi:hypothetical protein BN2476_770036 [Paraburkholderia piptadeniae]|uniref:Uncharacterized protein n=1 Tax=Paraburkholderia piptadeniae TaxID=1701573 RepID=A0A1N7SSG3_9BURK|nr:hypothetical protein BN2476_770036 [Paraburkholderia piptadeniae]
MVWATGQCERSEVEQQSGKHNARIRRIVYKLPGINRLALVGHERRPHRSRRAHGVYPAHQSMHKPCQSYDRAVRVSRANPGLRKAYVRTTIERALVIG